MAGSTDDRTRVDIGDGQTAYAAPVTAIQMFDYEQVGSIIAAANQSTTLIPAVEFGRAAAFVYNGSTKEIWVNVFGGVAAVGGLGCFKVDPGMILEISSSKKAINVLTLEANAPITAGVA